MTILGKTYSAESLDSDHPCPIHRRVLALHMYSEKKKQLGTFNYSKEERIERKKRKKEYHISTMAGTEETESNIRGSPGENNSNPQTITEKQITRGNPKHKKKVPIGKNGKRYYPLAVYK